MPSQSCEMIDIACHAENFNQMISDGYLSLTYTIWDKGVGLIEDIPVPSGLTTISNIDMPTGAMWVANALEIPFGLGLMTSAWIIRFMIRRIPFIG